MKERAVSFAPGGRLTGVVTEPDPADARSGAPAVITLNVGLVHHVGPYRFYVDLARKLAQRGFTSLRFDLSGHGNSAVRRDTLAAGERALDDLNEAMGFLTQRHGHTRFVPIGFCSSVDPVHQLAVKDLRVFGAVFIEGYAYRTRGYYLNFPLRYLEPGRWRRAISRNLPPRLRALPALSRLGQFSTAMVSEDEVYVRDSPSQEQLRRDLQSLNARGTRQLFIYVRSNSINRADQFLEFTGQDALAPNQQVAYLPEADHTFFRVVDREHAMATICDWLDRGAPR